MRTRQRSALAFGVLLLSALAIGPKDLQASIEDQRARLPPAPNMDECIDEVSGVWRAHVYYARLRDWYRYELRIQRHGDVLTGSIWLRGWTGRPDESEPPVCRPGLRDAEWSETATGSVTHTAQGTAVRFDATSWRLERTHCGSESGEFALDHFSGLIDGQRQEFTSINSYEFSTGERFEDPTLFRRIECTKRSNATGAVRPAVIVQGAGSQPPPALPETRRRRFFGCSR